MRLYHLCILLLSQNLFGMNEYTDFFSNNANSNNLKNCEHTITAPLTSINEKAKQNIDVNNFEEVKKLLDQMIDSLNLLSLEYPQARIDEQSSLSSLVDFIRMVEASQFKDSNSLFSSDDPEDALVLNYASKYQYNWKPIIQYIELLEKIENIINKHGNQLSHFISHCSSYSYYCNDFLEGWKTPSVMLLEIANNQNSTFTAIRQCIEAATAETDITNATIKIDRYRVYINETDIKLFDYFLSHSLQKSSMKQNKRMISLNIGYPSVNSL